ncbi:Pantothenate kinase [Pseudovibrio sp. W64]|uniref:type I pantothenate kinase n=1 Tax=unclassified Pseudovibrio TaxID=2627060 RepID=UPI00070D574B|nr:MULTISPECIES: type I pantothenate kinase [unclassified Pseudovibrio]KZK87296.1 Pantothenate kinase [Pseudovibrio sp. Ad13]KZK89061.1 Pantothenate kinase [Pseudovibrio sp. Ad5]KZK89271.1 Pantothenate kinase [Pseudovibrio sp. W64]KZK95518.1 Pantothenate kinase [Pseudovibrio sp. Ad46]KZL02690.1 Pantothenate kinase [Pseudovibrio sp. W74]
MHKEIAPVQELDLSPYSVFTETEWASLRAGTPMTLSMQEIEDLQSLNDFVSQEQVKNIYLPLSRLLAYYVEASQSLQFATKRFLGMQLTRTPFIIGIAGSVSVGKSTTARLLQALLSRWPASPKVDLITTDGFLYPNSVLETEGLMRRKGFPESYDRSALLKFLTDIKGGERKVRAPIYSHFFYDVMPGQHVTVEQPDILIVEGLNVLQTSHQPKAAKAVPFVSDFFDFSIYIDAEEQVLQRWYLERFMRLRETAFRDPGSYFHKFSTISNDKAQEIAKDLWQNINLENLRQNILPTRPRADLILTKGTDHSIETVALRKI